MRQRISPAANGVLLIALFALAAYHIAALPLCRSLSLSPLIIGIVLGMVYANTLRPQLPEAWAPGVRLCSKTVLRTAIVFYGFRLTVQNVMEVGAPAIVVDLLVVGSVLLLGILLGRALRMDRDTTVLTACGSAICGAAAVLGTEPVLQSKPHKTAVAVSTVVIFGTVSMFLHPALYRAGILSPISDWQMALFTGSTLHEVAHVVGAGNAMSSELIASNAIIVKMIRVILLAPALIVLSLLFKPEDQKGEDHGKRRGITVPRFAIGFLIAIGINSAVQLLIAGSPSLTAAWATTTGHINQLDTFALTMAMTALGAETSFDKFRHAGPKPFLLALLLFGWLFAFGLLLTKYLAPMLA
ncbi:MAG: YeiH family putative sulfate export transporter [Bacteroidia bacterium]|nr:MAG: YeiH family putative sulfate export transporter [Bacteroidia bacterium]